jgi:hypothetical protein
MLGLVHRTLTRRRLASLLLEHLGLSYHSQQRLPLGDARSPRSRFAGLFGGGMWVGMLLFEGRVLCRVEELTKIGPSLEPRDTAGRSTWVDGPLQPGGCIGG